MHPLVSLCKRILYEFFVLNYNNFIYLKVAMALSARVRQILEMAAVFIFVTVVIAFAIPFMELGKNVPMKLFFQLLPYVVMTGGVILVCKIKKVSLAAALGFTKKNVGRQILIALPIFTLTAALFVGIPFLLGFSKDDVLSFKPLGLWTLAFYIFYDMIVVGFGEEIIFRGYFFVFYVFQTAAQHYIPVVPAVRVHL
jgi:membrane protease YdiL (CAAX protease family)